MTVAGLLGILIGLGLLIALAFRGWSVLLLAPLAALIAALFSREPLLAHWTQTFMGSAAGFLAQFFPLFLLGALFGKLMEDSGSVAAIAHFMTERLGPQRAMLAVVLAGALVTYGGVSLFVAFFVLAPMAQELFRARRHPAASDAGRHRARHLDLHHVGTARHALDPERDPDAVLRHHALCRARPRHPRIADHARLRPVVAQSPGGDRKEERRKFWRWRADAARPSRRRRKVARTRHHRARVRSGGDRARRVPTCRLRPCSPRCRSSR